MSDVVRGSASIGAKEVDRTPQVHSLCCHCISQYGISAVHPGESEVDIVGIA